MAHLVTHSLTLTHSLTNSLSHTLTNSLTHLLTYLERMGENYYIKTKSNHWELFWKKGVLKSVVETLQKYL